LTELSRVVSEESVVVRILLLHTAVLARWPLHARKLDLTKLLPRYVTFANVNHYRH